MGQLDDKGGSSSLLRMDSDVPLMQLDNPLHQSHTDTMTFGHLFLFTPVKQGEQVFLIGFGHAHSVVRQADDGPFLPKGNLYERGFVCRILAVVLYQVGKGDIQQIQVPADRYLPVVIRIILFEKQFDVIVGVCLEQVVPGIEQQLVQTDFLHFQLFLLVISLGQIQQTVNKFCHSPRIVQCMPDGIPVLFLGPLFL